MIYFKPGLTVPGRGLSVFHKLTLSQDATRNLAPALNAFFPLECPTAGKPIQNCFY
jgi:hypothetical protein